MFGFAELLALIGWMSVFIEAWLLLTERIPNTNTTWFFWGFFLVVALIATIKSLPVKCDTGNPGA